MKIAILTLPLHTNYGGILQAYALQTILERMGHEVWVIDTPRFWHLPFYKLPFSYAKRLLRKYVLGKKLRVFAEQYHNRTYPIIIQHLKPFIDKYIHRLEVSKLSSLEKYNFEAIVVGSDQIWRPRYYLPIENAYLEFAKMWNVKRISYAASFGTDEWEYTPKQTIHCMELIKKFDSVSVREDSGLILCSKYLGVKAQHVLDPTMLLDLDDYINLFKVTDTPKSKGTLLNYILDDTCDKSSLVDSIAKERGLIAFRVNSKVESTYVPLEERIQPPIEQWIRGFYDAEFIVTDSFHACVFSILFGKPFVVIGNKERGMARFKSLLGMFGMEYRLISDMGEYDKIKDKPLTVPYQKISDYKTRSMNYLLNNLKR